MSVTILEDGLPADLPDIVAAYPFKQYQTAFQGIDRADLARFHLARLRLDWERNPREGVWMAVGKRTGNTFSPPTHAFGHLVRSSWHSDMLCREFYRLRPFLVRPGAEDLAAELVRSAVRNVAETGGEVLEIRIDVEDLAVQRILSASEFQPLGTSVKMSARDRDLTLPEPVADPEITVSDAESRDVARIQDIVRNSHVTSHYFNGGVFGRDRVRNLFLGWAERCVNGLAERVLVARLGKLLAGFVTLLVNRSLAECAGTPIGIVDFVAVAPGLQGRGIGSELLRAGLEHLRRECSLFEVRTELDNFPAIRTYSKLGFRLTSADQVLLHAAEKQPAGE